MKPGYKTSEFWLATVGVVGLLVDFARQNCTITPEKGILLATVIISYIAGRSYLKTKTDEKK